MHRQVMRIVCINPSKQCWYWPHLYAYSALKSGVTTAANKSQFIAWISRHVVRRSTAVSCARTAEPIEFPMCPRGRTHCRHLANTIELSVYGGDAPYVKLLWPLVIFGLAHLVSRTDSRALRVEYCIVGIPHNAVIYTVSQKRVPP